MTIERLVPVTLIAALALPAAGQTYVYLGDPTPAYGYASIFPFCGPPTQGEIRYQIRIPAASLAGVPPILAGLAFVPVNGATFTSPNFEMRIGVCPVNPPGSPSLTFANNLVNPVILRSGPLSWPYTPNTWSEFPLDGATYLYDGTSSLMLEVRYTGVPDGGDFRTPYSGNPWFGLTFGPGSQNAATMAYWGQGPGAKVRLRFERVTPVGTGSPGAGGPITMSAAGGLPAIGNAAFGLATANIETGSPWFLIVAAATANAPAMMAGANVWLDMPSVNAFFQLGLNPFAAGTTSGGSPLTTPLPVPNIPSLIGTALAFQVGAFQPTIGFGTSNAILLVIGP